MDIFSTLKKAILSLILCFTLGAGFAQESDLYLKNETHTFTSAFSAYKAMAEKYPTKCRFQQFGSSDYGIPVPLFVLNESGLFTAAELENKNVILINNAIHPGEPCGVDASIKLAQDLLKNGLPKNVIIAIIPIYNIGGAHNRNCCSRANQNGPLEYGFRGNSKNLDLNRDFIKADSKNTLAFYKIFHYLRPSIFIDTHTSNGADYQHTMTLITSQLNKMNPELAAYTKEKLNPHLFNKMAEGNYPMVPYVHSIKGIPDNGIKDYLETPRYSTGYTNLFNTISYVAEAHMLKSYEERVKSTYLLLAEMIEYVDKNHKELSDVRKKSRQTMIETKRFALNWKLDTTQYDTIPFLGYTAQYKKSKVTGVDRLFYNRDMPFKKHIKYYNTYTPTSFVTAPEYYIIPQTWDIIVDRLRANNVPVYKLKKETNLIVEMYEILDYDTKKSPYEGHYLHSNIQVNTIKQNVTYRKGDFVVPVKNESIRFIIETLEPHAPDSYFAWNYFDAVLQQKEWFSAYVFEDEAAEMLNNDPSLRTDFEFKKSKDSTFASNAFAQLYYLYKKSPNYEQSNNKYPITRLMKSLDPALLEDPQ
ncbi:MAG: hypothetical protein GQ574_06790 [Crocinitomix sp.]|nr:hypothetical protein [Crocinitomix sp.]